MNERTDRIRDVLAKHGNLAVSVYDVADDESLYDAGLTSHAVVNVMLALENEFDTEFPVESLKRSTFETVDSLSIALDEALEA